MLKLLLLSLISSNWLWLPLVPKGEDCSAAQRLFSESLIHRLSQSLAVSFTSDLDQYPCAQEDCALLRGRRASAPVVLYGAVNCEETLTRVRVSLLRVGSNTGDEPRGKVIASFAGAVQDREGLSELAKAAQLRLARGEKRPPPPRPQAEGWAGRLGLWQANDHVSEIPGLQMGLWFTRGAPWSSLRWRWGVGADLLQSREQVEERLRLEGRLRWRLRVQHAGPWLSLGLGLGWRRQQRVSWESVRDDKSWLQLDRRNAPVDEEGALFSLLSAVGYRFPDEAGRAWELALSYTPSLNAPTTIALSGGLQW